MADKRSFVLEPDSCDGTIVPSKKARTEDDVVQRATTKDDKERTSLLAASNIQLSGHAGELLSIRFSPDGQCLASASFDKDILCWRVYDNNENYMAIKGHRSAVLEVHWFTDGEALLSCAADKTTRCWDAESGLQIKKLCEHNAIVNSCCPLRRGPKMFVTGADDATVKVWDMRMKKSVYTMRDGFPVCAVAFADAGDQVFSGGVDNVIKVWDLRRGSSSSPTLLLKGHGDTVTGLRLSPDGSHLLSNSMDNTLREWDVRPFAPQNRCTKVFTGHMHNFEKNLLRCDYSPDGSRVACGSADRMVYIWDTNTRKVLYVLPGHTGSVNEVIFHPKEPIIASASSDKNIFLGELVH
ncbi:WD-repeat protein 57 [Volvox africanus]|uniref:WD-repeat protein 57 n=1 Tax=Volvox africanus TaxID=51714 RepID=A0ABQ5S080_9CHLO|nr:WD-repeat protein 57 [Volvox africanus]